MMTTTDAGWSLESHYLYVIIIPFSDWRALIDTNQALHKYNLSLFHYAMIITIILIWNIHIFNLNFSSSIHNLTGVNEHKFLQLQDNSFKKKQKKQQLDIFVRAGKTIPFCYFAQSCPTNTFRDIAKTFCLNLWVFWQDTPLYWPYLIEFITLHVSTAFKRIVEALSYTIEYSLTYKIMSSS